MSKVDCGGRVRPGGLLLQLDVQPALEAQHSLTLGLRFFTSEPLMFRLYVSHYSLWPTALEIPAARPLTVQTDWGGWPDKLIKILCRHLDVRPPSYGRTYCRVYKNGRHAVEIAGSSLPQCFESKVFATGFFKQEANPSSRTRAFKSHTPLLLGHVCLLRTCAMTPSAS